MAQEYVVQTDQRDAPEAEPLTSQAPTSLLGRIAALRIGFIPLPLFAVILAVLGAYCAVGKVPADLTTNILILAVGGYACAELGRHLPYLKLVGAAAILATFVPSFLVHAGVLPAPLVASINSFTDQSNVLYLYIASIIVGSMFGMDRAMMVGGFLRIVVPVVVGTVAAFVVGSATGPLLGLGLRHTVFMVVLPVMAGGVGEGAIPLSLGYAALSGLKQGPLLAEILPAVMFGNLMAVLIAGGLNLMGKRHPQLTGNGHLRPEDADDLPVLQAATAGPAIQDIGTGVVLAMTLFTIGALVQRWTNFPGPVTMLFLVVALKLARAVPTAIEQGAYRNYQFFAQIVTYPVLFAIGVSKTPWEKLASAFSVPVVVTIMATVVTLVGTGILAGRLVRIFPVEAGIIAACRASQGGTGDVAILSAANRMAMMPFAQVATRIGGALTVTAALALFAHYG